MIAHHCTEITYVDYLQQDFLRTKRLLESLELAIDSLQTVAS